ncbi:unnamed protein product [Cuscuta epithymum]|uniref:Uncharacterized protein n=1 Tax=Cuscuta epithymum TaxID=186058 RepID=A0AAV0EDC1_9ASTE|nr:unnamed protein product [Cuscuta epithymum]CAH9119241.1 unnamed protein product [Cuscuta epithymum]
MTMLRSLTTRKSPHAYEQLTRENEGAAHDLFEPKLSRTTSVQPAKSGVFSSSSSKRSTESPAKAQAKQAEKASKIHPIFSLFTSGQKRNKGVGPTARPEFSRYLEYLKEGGFGGALDMAAAKSSMSAK